MGYDPGDELTAMSMWSGQSRLNGLLFLNTARSWKWCKKGRVDLGREGEGLVGRCDQNSLQKILKELIQILYFKKYSILSCWVSLNAQKLGFYSV